MSERVGVYICHCGSNIAGTVDVQGLSAWAQSSLPDVVVAQDYKFVCSSLGQVVGQDELQGACSGQKDSSSRQYPFCFQDPQDPAGRKDPRKGPAGEREKALARARA